MNQNANAKKGFPFLKTIFLKTLFILFAGSVAVAQNPPAVRTITGTVTDAQTQEALASVCQL
jgi:hypothetical protein